MVIYDRDSAVCTVSNFQALWVPREAARSRGPTRHGHCLTRHCPTTSVGVSRREGRDHEHAGSIWMGEGEMGINLDVWFTSAGNVCVWAKLVSERGARMTFQPYFDDIHRQNNGILLEN